MQNFHRRRVRKKTRWPLYISIIILLLIISNLNRNLWRDPSTETINFNISQGSSGKEIAKQLEKEKVISSKFLFRLKSRKYDPIQAGIFEIPEKANVSDILNIITKPAENLKITIPEGYTIKQIDEKLAKEGLIITGEFIECTKICPLPQEFKYKSFFNQNNDRNLEGFLFPNTYFLNKNGFNTQTFLNQLLTEFQSQIEPIEKQNQTGKNLYEVITMASIVEKEVRTPNDMPIVAGLLWKRLDSDWTIGADATLLYEKNNRNITATDLNSDSPYNTRKFKGLPPTPINNPGLATIKAALQPKSSRYWFYLTPPSGEVIYAETNDEHNANKRKYL